MNANDPNVQPPVAMNALGATSPTNAPGGAV